MNRRNFLSLGLSAVAISSLAPSLLSAKTAEEATAFVKGTAWRAASKTEDAIKEVFGSSATEAKKVKIKAPDIAENGAVIPVTVESKLAGSKVAIFQDANPESTVAIFTVPANGIIDYSIRIKMQKTGTVTAVVEAGGKLYSASKEVKVTIGGCGG